MSLKVLSWPRHAGAGRRRRPGPAGMRHGGTFSSPRCGESTPVLLVADPFHHLDVLAIEMLHDGDVRHARRRRGPVPMLLVRGSMDDIPRPDLLDRASPTLHPAGALRHDQALAERVRVPYRPGT